MFKSSIVLFACFFVFANSSVAFVLDDFSLVQGPVFDGLGGGPSAPSVGSSTWGTRTIILEAISAILPTAKITSEVSGGYLDVSRTDALFGTATITLAGTTTNLTSGGAAGVDIDITFFDTKGFMQFAFNGGDPTTGPLIPIILLGTQTIPWASIVGGAGAAAAASSFTMYLTNIGPGGVGGYDVIFDSVTTVVPEPASVSLAVLTGIFGWMAYKKRNKNRTK